MVKNIFSNSEKFGSSFVENGIIYLNLPFMYKSAIIGSLLKTVTLKFTMYILTSLTYTLKLCVIGK